jgi:hypothetical protein
MSYGNVGLADAVTERHILPGECIRRIRPALLRRPAAVGRPHATGEQPVWPTGAEVVVGFQPPLPGEPPRPVPPPPPSPVPPPVVSGEPVTQRLTVPDGGPPRTWHPRHRRPIPMRSFVLVGLGTGMSGAALVVVPALAWVVAQ